MPRPRATKLHKGKETWTILQDGKAVEVDIEDATDWVREHSPSSMPELIRRIEERRNSGANEPTT